MEWGLHCWNFSEPPDIAEIATTLAATAELAEQEGFAEFSVVDHFFQMEHVAPADPPIRYGWTERSAGRASQEKLATEIQALS